MVSFQCHACGDVVKKPKLDQHRGRCHSGFDCIDCHTTFNNPGEYKGHTQCISEAEKYQKGLYKGPKGPTAAPRNNYPPLPVAEVPPGGSWPSRGGGGWGWGRTKTTATGANDTPLGTPARNSPIPAPTPKIPAAKEPIKPVVDAPAVITTPSDLTDKKKKDKKRKSTAAEDSNVNVDVVEHTNKKAKFAKDSEILDATSIALPASPSKEVEQKVKEKKSKKDKKNGLNEVDEQEQTKKERKKRRKEAKEAISRDDDIEMSAPSLEEKKEKKSKKSKRKEGKDDDAEMESTGSSKKRKRDVNEGEDGVGEVRRKEKNKTRSSTPDALNMSVDGSASIETTEKAKKERSRKEKKERKSKHHETTAAV